MNQLILFTKAVWVRLTLHLRFLLL